MNPHLQSSFTKPLFSFCFVIIWIFLLNPTNFAQSAPSSPEAEIWQKIVEANSIWLKCNFREITYEFVYRDENQHFGHHWRIWYHGPDKARLEDIGNNRIKIVDFNGFISERDGRRQTVIYNNGIRAEMGEEPSNRYNEKIPYGLDLGLTVVPPFLYLIQEKTIPSGFILKGKQHFNGNEYWWIEITNTVLRQPLFDFDALYFYYSRESHAPVSTMKMLVDPQTYTIARVESYLYSVGGELESSRPQICEFPAGYFATPYGFAPKSIVMKAEMFGRRIYAEFNFQLLPGGQWFGQEARLIINERPAKTESIRNVSLEPIDPSVFDLAAAGVKIAEPTPGTGSIAGKVLQQNTELPIAGARICLYGEPQKVRDAKIAEMVTDIDGVFQFQNLPDMRYILLAEKAGMVSAVETNHSGGDMLYEISIQRDKTSWRYVEIHNGSTQSNIEIHLADPRRVQGKVVRADNQHPIPEAKVSIVKREDYENPIEPQYTDENGRFEFQNLSARGYRFVAQKEGFFSPSWAIHESQLKKNFTQEVDLSSVRSCDDVLLQLSPAGIMEGKVLDPEGNPVPNAAIYLAMSKLAESDEQGNYRINSLPTQEINDRSFELIANASGFLGTTVGPLQLSVAAPLHRDIVLNTGGFIAGTVTDATGEPIANLNLDLSFQARRNFFMNDEADMHLMQLGMLQGDLRLKTDDQGEFLSNRLLPENYWIRAATDGYEKFAQRDIKVENNKTTRVDIQLQPTLPIAGIVLGATGDPMMIVRVNIKLNKNSVNDPAADDIGKDIARYTAEESIVTATGGKFVFKQMPQGIYTITAAAPKTPDKVPQTQTVENVYPGQTDIEIHFDSFRKSPALTGQVIDAESGKPITQYKISVGDLYANRKAIENASGMFHLENLPTGKIEGLVSAQNYGFRQIGPFQLQPDRIHETFVMLRPEGIVKGRVQPDTSRKEYGITVRIQQNQSADLTPHWKRENRLTDLRPLGVDLKQEKDGAFMLSNLPGGKYDLEITDNAYHAATVVNVSITAGQTTNLGLIPWRIVNDIEENRTISFTLKKPDGNPWVQTPVQLISNYYQESSPIQNTNSEGKCKIRIYQSRNQYKGIVLGEFLQRLLPIDAGRPDLELVIPEFPAGDAKLEGTISARSFPLSVQQVILIAKEEKSYRIYKTKTNALNHYSFTGLIPGKYALLVTDVYQMDPTAPFYWLEGEIGQGEKRNLNIIMDGDTLVGQILDRYNQPASGAYLQIRLPTDWQPLLQAYLGKGPALSVQADEFGIFSLPNLQPGKYEIWASRFSLGVSKKQALEIPAGKDVKVKLVLE